MRLSIPMFLICSSLLSAPAFAQDSDEIELRCSQSKFKAAGKGCACVHKAWSKAIALGVLPDLTTCEEKLAASFTKAEDRAAAAGGACLVGESVALVAEALAAAADKTATQVGRGVITPAPDACDAVSVFVTYSGGNYAKFPKCVKRQAGDVDCSGAATRKKMAEVLQKDFRCPECPEGEEGCDEYVGASTVDMEETQAGTCCLKTGPDTKKSIEFLVRCSLCVTP